MGTGTEKLGQHLSEVRADAALVKHKPGCCNKEAQNFSAHNKIRIFCSCKCPEVSGTLTSGIALLSLSLVDSLWGSQGNQVKGRQQSALENIPGS